VSEFFNSHRISQHLSEPASLDGIYGLTFQCQARTVQVLGY
jgi:hypothetical protein